MDSWGFGGVPDRDVYRKGFQDFGMFRIWGWGFAFGSELHPTTASFETGPGWYAMPQSRLLLRV